MSSLLASRVPRSGTWRRPACPAFPRMNHRPVLKVFPPERATASTEDYTVSILTSTSTCQNMLAQAAVPNHHRQLNSARRPNARARALATSSLAHLCSGPCPPLDNPPELYTGCSSCNCLAYLPAYEPMSWLSLVGLVHGMSSAPPCFAWSINFNVLHCTALHS